ncbi:hypothetical protein M422DRAFT_212789 [Sphaerobolus stellatus SS14]|uniref:Uncharacterized protein n=1 Tax=Sphaerobolus stellatus (strain SS14) TaxID=990650 RepID=A0A0C9VCH3_SPHS4|nr:hypothetical protein M422DRAFT_212789 [Sphaerobolus stellatus SS14]
MPDIALDKTYLVTLWVETLLYGSYAVLFSICIHILVFGPKRGVNRNLLVTAVAMFALSTIHVCVDLARAINAFITNSHEPEGASEYYAQIWLWLNIFKQALYATNNILADGLVIYRCYIVWGFHWKIIVLPSIMLIGTTVCGYLAVFNFSQVVPGQNVFALNIAEWGTALFSLSLATNIVVTSLIAGRIWWISRQTQAHVGRKHRQKYNNAVAIILESGAIYSVSQMTLLILYCVKTNAVFIVYDALAQIMGIVPTLIIVRVGLGLTTQENTLIGSTRGTVPRFGTARGTGMAGFESRPVPLQVRKVVEIDADIESTSPGISTSQGYEDNYKSTNEL